ncbi:PP2C family protein-serine/threonine phosphatase [Nonomuraea aridisoli]|nr:PP2C family protein-serine/threonine phosphatase [Nonomuraea aridisoli]
MGKDAPYPMLDVTAAGVIERVNDAARELLTGACPGVPLARAAPAWLAQAHRAVAGGRARPGTGPAHGPVGERVFEAHALRADADRVEWWLLDVTGHRRAAEALRAEREWTGFLVEASRELTSSLNLDRCLEVTARLAARHLADAALVITPMVGRRHRVTVCDPHGRVVREDLGVDARTVPGLEGALRGYPPVPARWIDPARAPGWVVREGFGTIGSAVVMTLPGHGLPAGALVLLRRRRQQSFAPREEVFARLFAAWAGAAISVARMYAEQAAITETLMAELLPPVELRVNGAEVAARYRPAGVTELVGGDFYDVHPAAGSGREALVVLGDVAGKGLEAAVLTGKIRNTLHALLPMADDHHRILERLNDVLLAREHPTRFVTLVLASVAACGPRVALRVTSAGHPAPLILRNDGRVEAVEATGTLIGLLDSITSTTQDVLLDPGETCLLYSDGIIEARGGPCGDELFGEERLCERLCDCAGMPADAVAERVQMLASQWVGGGEHDDMAVVAITAPRGERA